MVSAILERKILELEGLVSELGVYERWLFSFGFLSRYPFILMFAWGFGWEDMGTRILELEDFARDNLGKILIGFGIILVIFGIFMLSTFGTIASASGLFIGFLSIIYGFFVQVGLFSVE
jgi:hypothetical protein